MNEFKVGDKVEIINGPCFGLNKEKELIIKEIYSDGTVLISDDDTEAYKQFENIKLIKKGEDNMDNELKIGDKARVIGKSAYHNYQIGDIVTIKDFWLDGTYTCVNGKGEQIISEEDLEKISKEISNGYKPNDKVVVTDSDCIGYSLNDVLIVSKVLYDDVLEVSDEYGDIGLIKTEYIKLVEQYVEKEKFEIGDFVKVVETDREYVSLGTIGLVSHAYQDGNVDLAIVDSDGDFHSDLIFANNEVEKIEIGEL